MTTVAINRVNQDQTVLELMQTGKSETSCNLRVNLLDDKLNYMFAVNSLSVPLNRAPLNPVKVYTELFRVRRRNVGASSIVNAQLDLPDWATFAITPNQFFDIGDLVRKIANFARGFNIQQSLAGMEDIREYGGDANEPSDQAALDADDTLDALEALDVDEMEPGGAVEGGFPFIQIRLSADASLRFVGSQHFWNNFVIRFSSYGAALLGFQGILEDNYLAFTADALGRAERGGWRANDAPRTILKTGLEQEAIADGLHPLYQSADQRVKITVESHLPMASNISIVDQTESVDRTIAEKYFENKLETIVVFDDSGVFKNSIIKSKLYSGQVSFIKKSDVHVDWYKLLTAYALRFFRFYLYITYRKWDGTKNTFKLDKQLLEVPKNKYWDMSIKFVSEV